MKSFLIKNKRNMRVEILDWGCRIVSIRVPDRNGKLIDTVLKYKNIADYKKDKHYLGSTVGRYANRIENGKFNLHDSGIQLSQNESGKNHLHGGFIGFDKKYWNLTSHTENSIEMQILSPAGDEGYPGNLTVDVRYEVSEDNILTIDYHAKADEATLVNITNHSYFNLSDNRDSIDSHELQVNAEYYTPLSDGHLPVPPYREKVKDTIYDLTELRPIDTLKEEIGNINYCMDPTDELRRVATIKDIESGRRMTISSDYPGIQVYFGNYLSGDFKPFQGMCCEPHYFPNSPNINIYPSALLLPGDHYEHRIKYSFENF